MSKTIKVHQGFYTIHLKGGEEIQVNNKAYEQLKPVLIKGEQQFIEIGNNIYNRFEITKVVEGTVANSVEAYIMQQPKSMRNKIRSYSRSNHIKWRSKQHVDNFIKHNLEDEASR